MAFLNPSENSDSDGSLILKIFSESIFKRKHIFDGCRWPFRGECIIPTQGEKKYGFKYDFYFKYIWKSI